MDADSLSWREQLNRVREQVQETEQRRQLLKKMELEHSREALSERLREDTPQALLARTHGLRDECQKKARKIYPPSELRQQLETIAELGERLRFYRDCQKDHPDLFTAEMRQTLLRLLKELGELQRGLDRQLKQWAPVEELLAKAAWRPPTKDDARRLLTISKEYNGKAFGITVSLPADFYARETENFYVAEAAGSVIGFVKCWPEDTAVTPTVASLEGVNFHKLIRGFLSTFYHTDLFAAAGNVVRVRLNHPAEFRAFADMGFARAETKSMSESVYQWEMD